MSYISSGQFRADIEAALGLSLSRDEPEADEPDEDEDAEVDSLARFPEPLRAQLVALREFVTDWSLPPLCVLRWGDFCSVPELTGEERDEVLEDWFAGDETATDFVMRAVDIVNGGGGYYVVVDTDGRMGLVCEDPYSFDPLDCDLSQFLRALVDAHRAACTEGLEAAQAALGEVVDESTAKLLLTFAGRLAPPAS
jgi:hypothetical protein